MALLDESTSNQIPTRRSDESPWNRSQVQEKKGDDERIVQLINTNSLKSTTTLAADDDEKTRLTEFAHCY